jgi:thioredoxin reductase
VQHYDVLIVGGGPAGLSAGLWLARYRRRVRILDSGRPRNDSTWGVHGYPGLADPPPHELRRVLMEQALAAGATWQSCEVTNVQGQKNDFNVSLQDGEELRSRRIVLAYGRRDVLPDIEGIEALYGKSVFHCPDCDGPSMLRARIAVIGWERKAALLALYLLTWGQKVSLLTHGRTLEVGDDARTVLAKYDIDVETSEIARLCASDERLTAVEFRNGDALPVDKAFFHLGSHPASDLADQLGCKRDRDGNLVVDNANETSVAGIFSAGDLIGPPYLAISAAAEGVKTAIALHKSLLPPDQEI